VGFHAFIDACAVCRAGGPHAFLSVKAGGTLCSDCAPAGTRAVDAEVVEAVRLLVTPGEWASLPGLAATSVRTPGGPPPPTPAPSWSTTSTGGCAATSWSRARDRVVTGRPDDPLRSGRGPGGAGAGVESRTGAVDPTRIPAHVAIIMDGNGRWANQQGLKRNAGHEAGEAALFDTVEGALELGITDLTVYAFSTENWRRPAEEVRFLLGFNESLLSAGPGSSTTAGCGCGSSAAAAVRSRSGWSG
jgi:hypothetical protein